MSGGTSNTEFVYECRRCGTTVDAQSEECPYCGPADIVEYEIP
ncbi:hypothetical protein [Halorussus halophilus]|nr:hypothetical protein [Halorussus halophilus]